MQLPAVEDQRSSREARQQRPSLILTRDRKRCYLRVSETLTSCTFSEILLVTFLTVLTAALIVWFLFYCPTSGMVANGAQEVPNSRSTLDSILLIAAANRSLITSFHLPSSRGWHPRVAYRLYLVSNPDISELCISHFNSVLCFCRMCPLLHKDAGKNQ